MKKYNKLAANVS